MGFNAVRIEWSVDGLAATPEDFQTDSCDIATTADIQATMLPPTTADTPQPTGNVTLPEDPPTISNKVCSADLPTNSTQDRYVYLVHYLCGQASPFETAPASASRYPPYNPTQPLSVESTVHTETCESVHCNL